MPDQGSGVQPVVLRIGTIWGPLVDPESPFFHIPSYISAVLRGEEPPPLHADDGGDCCYAPDAGRAIALLMTAETLRHDTYNVSSGRPATNREFADALQAITPGLRLDLLPGRQDDPGDDPYLDTTRLTHDTWLRADVRRRHGGRRLRRVARRQSPLKEHTHATPRRAPPTRRHLDRSPRHRPHRRLGPIPFPSGSASTATESSSSPVGLAPDVARRCFGSGAGTEDADGPWRPATS